MTLIWMRQCWHGEVRVVALSSGSYLLTRGLRGGMPVQYEFRDRQVAVARGRAWAEANLPKSADEWKEL